MKVKSLVGVGFLVSENAESLRWLLNAFKGNNVNNQPRVIVADKNLNERHIPKKCFSSAFVLICLFHIVRSFKRELVDKRFSLKESQNITLKELFQNICYARNVKDYENTFKPFFQVAPVELRQYFLEH